MVGLLCLLAVPEVSISLKITRNTDSKVKAFKRYLATMKHIMVWYEGAIWDENDVAYQSINRVSLQSLHVKTYK